MMIYWRCNFTNLIKTGNGNGHERLWTETFVESVIFFFFFFFFLSVSKNSQGEENEWRQGGLVPLPVFSRRCVFRFCSSMDGRAASTLTSALVASFPRNVQQRKMQRRDQVAPVQKGSIHSALCRETSAEFKKSLEFICVVRFTVNLVTRPEDCIVDVSVTRRRKQINCANSWRLCHNAPSHDIPLGQWSVPMRSAVHAGAKITWRSDLSVQSWGRVVVCWVRGGRVPDLPGGGDLWDKCPGTLSKCPKCRILGLEVKPNPPPARVQFLIHLSPPTKPWIKSEKASQPSPNQIKFLGSSSP